jgi:hypothetical protein
MTNTHLTRSSTQNKSSVRDESTYDSTSDEDGTDYSTQASVSTVIQTSKPNQKSVQSSNAIQECWSWKCKGDFMERRGKNTLDQMQDVLGVIKTPFFKKWIKMIGSMLFTLLKSVVHGGVGIASVIASIGLDGDVIIDTVIAVLETVLRGLSTIQNAVYTANDLLGNLSGNMWLPFTNDINELYGQYLVQWRSNPNINQLRQIMQTNAARILNQVKGWASIIANWLSVIIPDDAGAVSIFVDVAGQISQMVIEAVKPELALIVMERIISALIKSLSKQTQKVLDTKLDWQKMIQNSSISETVKKVKIPFASYELKYAIAEGITSSERVVQGATSLEQVTAWTAGKAMRFVIILANHASDKNLQDLFIKDEYVEDLIMLHNQLPSIVHEIFQLFSIVIGFCALTAVASQPVSETTQDTEETISSEESGSEESDDE